MTGKQRVVDFTPGAGAAALAAIKQKIAYLAVTWTETHQTKLLAHLQKAVLDCFLKEGDVLFQPAYAALMGKNEKNPQDDPKTPRKPKEPKEPKELKESEGKTNKVRCPAFAHVLSA